MVDLFVRLGHIPEVRGDNGYISSGDVYELIERLNATIEAERTLKYEKLSPGLVDRQTGLDNATTSSTRIPAVGNTTVRTTRYQEEDRMVLPSLDHCKSITERAKELIHISHLLHYSSIALLSVLLLEVNTGQKKATL
jgi:hypothetical protein